MTQVIYVSEQYVKDFTIINQNTDINIFRQNLIIVQDIYITPFLGTAFDLHLKSQILNNTLTTFETDLLKLIRKAHALYVSYMSLDAILYRVVNKGLFNAANGQNGTSIDQASVNYLKKIDKDKAEFYINECLKFIEANKNEFPLFFTNNNCQDGSKKTFGFTIEYDQNKPKINRYEL